MLVPPGGQVRGPPIFSHLLMNWIRGCQRIHDIINMLHPSKRQKTQRKRKKLEKILIQALLGRA